MTEDCPDHKSKTHPHFLRLCYILNPHKGLGVLHTLRTLRFPLNPPAHFYMRILQESFDRNYTDIRKLYLYRNIVAKLVYGRVKGLNDTVLSSTT